MTHRQECPIEFQDSSREVTAELEGKKFQIGCIDFSNNNSFILPTASLPKVTQLSAKRNFLGLQFLLQRKVRTCM